MSSTLQNRYIPDVVSAPGETLAETLEAIGMSQAELAERTGHSKKMINEIIKGKAPITPRMALELERVLGVPASFWNNRERHYREALAHVEETARLHEQVAWLKEIPVGNMIKLGWIEKGQDKVAQLRNVLAFLGIASPDQWPAVCQALSAQVTFRQSAVFKVDNDALAIWMRKGVMDAKGVVCEPYDARKFKSELEKIRRLTADPPELFQPQLVQRCAACGVAVVFVPELPKTRVSGVTRWLTVDKAIIQLSLRYGTDDHLWFTFFHEAGHILKHGKKEIFIEDAGLGMDEVKEAEANRFAAEFLIPNHHYKKLVKKKPFSKEAICRFAHRLGIAPSIVVGRLQHDGHLPMTHCNDLKTRLAWPDQAG